MRRAIVLPILLLATAAPAQTGWNMVGEREIVPEASSDAITFGAPMQLRRFMLCVDLAPVRFRGLTIRFTNGTTRQIAFRDRVRAGSCGRALSIGGRDGPVAAIAFDYDAASLGTANARVQAFGG